MARSREPEKKSAKKEGLRSSEAREPCKGVDGLGVVPTPTAAPVFYPKTFHEQICALPTKKRPEHGTFPSTLNTHTFIPYLLFSCLIFSSLSLILLPPCLQSGSTVFSPALPEKLLSHFPGNSLTKGIMQAKATFAKLSLNYMAL